MAGQNNLDLHVGDALHDGVEVIDLEPEQHTIAVGPVRAIADGAMMVLDFKAVQLQDERTVFHQLFIVLAAVSAAASQQTLIPATARFDVRNAYERLGAHGCESSKS